MNSGQKIITADIWNWLSTFSQGVDYIYYYEKKTSLTIPSHSGLKKKTPHTVWESSNKFTMIKSAISIN